MSGQLLKSLSQYFPLNNQSSSFVLGLIPRENHLSGRKEQEGSQKKEMLVSVDVATHPILTKVPRMICFSFGVSSHLSVSPPVCVFRLQLDLSKQEQELSE